MFLICLFNHIMNWGRMWGRLWGRMLGRKWGQFHSSTKVNTYFDPFGVYVMHLKLGA